MVASISLVVLRYLTIKSRIIDYHFVKQMKNNPAYSISPNENRSPIVNMMLAASSLKTMAMVVVQQLKCDYERSRVQTLQTQLPFLRESSFFNISAKSPPDRTEYGKNTRSSSTWD